jgi:hypothetical protein
MGHIPRENRFPFPLRHISGGKMTFPLDMGHIWGKRLIEEGKIVFPLDLRHIRRENDFPCGYESLDDGKMIFPSALP